jgi:SAM-dependent methyltransferase
MVDSFARNPASTRAWSSQELEEVSRCPYCGSRQHSIAHEAIPDRIAFTEGLWTYRECVQCRSLFVSPRPTESSIYRAYEHYYTHQKGTSRPRTSRLDRIAFEVRNGYLARKFGFQSASAANWGFWIMYLLPPWLRLEWDHHARNLPAKPAGRPLLVDVGCGDGAFAASAATAGWRVVATDPDPEACRIARHKNIEVHCGQLPDVRLQSASAQVITMSHVLEHSHDPSGLLRECYRILRSDGVLWIALPNRDGLFYRVFGRDWFDLCSPQHLSLPSIRGLRGLLDSLGFTSTLMRRGAHAQSHWRACVAVRRGGCSEDVYLRSFFGRKADLLGAVLDAVVWLNPRFQGDIVLKCTKRTAAN